MKPTIPAVLFGLITGLASANTTIDSISLPGGTSAVGSYTLASVYGQPTVLDVASFGDFDLEPGFLCIEVDDVPLPGDVNRDGRVNGIDLAYVIASWGPCNGQSCIADLDGNGTVNPLDLGAVLAGWTG
jgi:hypothetical protein